MGYTGHQLFQQHTLLNARAFHAATLKIHRRLRRRRQQFGVLHRYRISATPSFALLVRLYTHYRRRDGVT